MSESVSTIIPQANPLAGYLARQREIDAALARALASGRYIMGQEVEAFEREFAVYQGTRHAVSVANGTDAIELALRAAGIGAGDLVFTVSHTAVATVAAVERAGAVPVLVDIDPLRYTMAPEHLEAAIAQARRDPELQGARQRAVLPVHLYGQPADIEAIAAIAARSGLLLIEDCAQAHGATVAGRRVGTWGMLASFSFYPTKNLGAMGDGGAIITDDAAIARRLRALRQYGWEERYISASRGLNSRLDEIQAALLRVRLRHLDADNEARRRVAARYDAALDGLAVAPPARAAGIEHVYHQYVLRTPMQAALRHHLADAGIGTAIHYPVPIHLQPAYQGQIALAQPLAETEAAAREVVSLPMFPELSSGQVDRVCAALRAWSASAVPVG